ncbi:MAG TPA: polysaccharide biosynthesis/export family protein [Gemmatimonadales bacterium]|nr:polysaccharide biosynthesis/export family protein [Gemmatimonadales bacterium]
MVRKRFIAAPKAVPNHRRHALCTSGGKTKDQPSSAMLRALLLLALLGFADVVMPSLGSAQAPAAAQNGARSADSAATLRPGDVIRLKIWREPDFSGDFTISDAGSAVLPRLGPVPVASYTVDSLTRTLVARYAAFLVNPSIEVTALRRVNVLGSVKNPGLYQVDPTMTVADALALAGGVASDGKSDHIELVRDGRRMEVALAAETRLADTPIRSGDQLYVPQRSWLSRNVGVLAAGVSAIGLVAAAAIN